VLNDFTSNTYPNYIDPEPGTIDHNLRNSQADERHSIFRARPLDEHSIAAEPLLTDAGNGNYTLQANSPTASIGFTDAVVPLEPH